MTIPEMTFLNVQERMTRTNSKKKLAGIFQEIGVCITKNYPPAEFFKGVLTIKNLRRSFILKRAGPFADILLPE